jgi:hypothetical protein
MGRSFPANPPTTIKGCRESNAATVTDEPENGARSPDDGLSEDGDGQVHGAKGESSSGSSKQTFT